MDSELDRIERLAALKNSGAITEDEFLVHKANVLQGISGAAASPAVALPSGPQMRSRPLNAKWQKRFEFFDTYGSPKSDAGRAALREMSFGERIAITHNFIGFFFGIIYLAVLGLWKQLVVIVAANITGVVLMDAVGFSDRAQWAVSLGLCALIANTVNYAYYRKRTTGLESWNFLPD